MFQFFHSLEDRGGSRCHILDKPIALSGLFEKAHIYLSVRTHTHHSQKENNVSSSPYWVLLIVRALLYSIYPFQSIKGQLHTAHQEYNLPPGASAPLPPALLRDLWQELEKV